MKTLLTNLQSKGILPSSVFIFDYKVRVISDIWLKLSRKLGIKKTKTILGLTFISTVIAITSLPPSTIYGTTLPMNTKTNPLQDYCSVTMLWLPA